MGGSKFPWPICSMLCSWKVNDLWRYIHMEMTEDATVQLIEELLMIRYNYVENNIFVSNHWIEVFLSQLLSNETNYVDWSCWLLDYSLICAMKFNKQQSSTYTNVIIKFHEEDMSYLLPQYDLELWGVIIQQQCVKEITTFQIHIVTYNLMWNVITLW